MRIGIDLMGSDSSPQQLLQGALHAASECSSSVKFIFLAEATLLSELKNSCKELSFQGASLQFQAADASISMEDDPLTAVRTKKDSSLIQGVLLLEQKRLDALVTAGNTGALIAGATIFLPLLPGIKRPGFLATLPTKKGSAALIDAGGHLIHTTTTLVDSAFLGAAYRHCHYHQPRPTVGLLNIGAESKKGPLILREAYAALKEYSERQSAPLFNFKGNIEARDIFEGTVDVVVTEGFSGNLLLKASEGTAGFILETLGGQSDSALVSRFDYSSYPGALLSGIDNTIVKCHGEGSPRALYHAIKGAMELVKNQTIPHMKETLSKTAR